MKVSFSVVCFALLCCLTGCFTGVENTGRISEKDVAKVKADKKTAEELFLDTVAPSGFRGWKPGKLLYVNDNNIRLIFDTSQSYDVRNIELEGDTLQYTGYKFTRQIDNEETVVISFQDRNNNVYHYNTGKTITEAEEQNSEYIVPFLIDLDYVKRMNDILTGNTYYIKTSLWMDEDRKPMTGVRYVPVRITAVTPGDVVYSFLVHFDYDGTKGCVYMSSQRSSIKNMTFDKLFSFSDIRKKYPSITDNNWELITKGKVAMAMTKEECSLSLGAPREIDRAATHGGLYERWSYDNGVYLVFESGILIQFRQ